MYNLRMQEGVGLRSAEGYRDLRARKRRICNIIRNSTWLAESSILLACVVLELLSVNVDSYLTNSISDTLSTLVFWRIISPYSHLFNEQRIKVIALNEGWISAMHHALNFHVSPRNIQHDAMPNSYRANSSPPDNIEELNRPSNEKSINKRSNVDPDANGTKVFSIKLECGGYREKCNSKRNAPVPAHMEPIVLPNGVSE
jgi:hypothetical protein